MLVEALHSGGQAEVLDLSTADQRLQGGACGEVCRDVATAGAAEHPLPLGVLEPY